MASGSLEDGRPGFAVRSVKPERAGMRVHPAGRIRRRYSLKEPLMSAIPFAIAGTGYGLIGILVIILLVVLILRVL